MYTSCFIAGLLLIFATLLDAFETILLPRRINRPFRYSRIYYRNGWAIWRRAAKAVPQGRVRESMLSVFGPLSMLGLFGSWIASLIIGFAVLFWSIHAAVNINGRPGAADDLATYLYLSGTNYFTLGLGDVTPLGRLARVLTVLESGVGLGFLAIIISYLPVLYQAFSRREVTISLMDARAGSPPSAGEFLVRLTSGAKMEAIDQVLAEWERWCAEVLESHISFPALAYYRSQHANQSWLASLATILDSCALMLSLFPPDDLYRVQMTFAMARHAAVDIALIFRIRPRADVSSGEHVRLPEPAFSQLRAQLRYVEPINEHGANAATKLAQLRGMYEPVLFALESHFVLLLPPVIQQQRSADNWQRSPWMPHTPGIGSLPASTASGDHFD